MRSPVGANQEPLRRGDLSLRDDSIRSPFSPEDNRRSTIVGHVFRELIPYFEIPCPSWTCYITVQSLMTLMLSAEVIRKGKRGLANRSRLSAPEVICKTVDDISYKSVPLGTIRRHRYGAVSYDIKSVSKYMYIRPAQSSLEYHTSTGTQQD